MVTGAEAASPGRVAVWRGQGEGRGGGRPTDNASEWTLGLNAPTEKRRLKWKIDICVLFFSL